MNKPKIQLILIESGIISLLLLGNDQESTTTEWRFLPWKRMEKQVFKLQKRIYQANQRGEVSVVRKLQKTLLNSWSAKCLAVRKVTQDNQGKKTAGIDGIKSLTPKQRLSLVEKLQLSNKSKPTRRIWIPKPGKKEQRPLGIPTMYDRALQALVKLAMEPEWEAVFEPNSYGFRPGRSAHDAIGAIYNSVSNKAKFALDADISQCFDKIDQSALLAKIGTFPKLRRQLKSWLKSGVIDGGRLMETNEGTPQGGVSALRSVQW
jgi:RNA-directed DNA polymerase